MSTYNYYLHTLLYTLHYNYIQLLSLGREWRGVVGVIGESSNDHETVIRSIGSAGDNDQIEIIDLNHEIYSCLSAGCRLPSCRCADGTHFPEYLLRDLSKLPNIRTQNDK